MNVRLINYTPKPIETAFVAARTCYSGDGPDKLWQISSEKDKIEIPREKMRSLLDKVITSGHLSVLEHVSLTFAIEDISRACSHQLVRHRIASFSQQSQRYVTLGKDEFVTPSTIAQNENAKKIFTECLNNIKQAYDRLISLDIPIEDARFILPNATHTDLIMTMNFRELYNVCQIRLCSRAQWEIRELFWRAKSELRKIAELEGFSEYLQPKCRILGYCPEAKSCGMTKSRAEVLGT